MPDSINICSNLGETALIKAIWSGGIDPFLMSWSNGENIDSIIVNPEEKSLYTFNILDGCNKEIFDSTIVWNQCPIEPINIFTPNGDNINDFFVPIHLEHYPNPSVFIYNRWGNLVYENYNYKYDWTGTHYKNGKNLSDDIYYYIIDPKSDKYEYSSSKVTSTFSGFVHIMRN